MKKEPEEQWCNLRAGKMWVKCDCRPANCSHKHYLRGGRNSTFCKQVLYSCQIVNIIAPLSRGGRSASNVDVGGAETFLDSKPRCTGGGGLKHLLRASQQTLGKTEEL